MFASSRWYYVLTIGFLVNFCIIVVLVLYILRWRRNHRNLIAANLESGGRPRPSGGSSVAPVTGVLNGGSRSSGNGNIMGNGKPKKKSSWPGVVTKKNNNSIRGYSPVKNSDVSPMSSVPFRDYDSSSEDEELFRKPYTDEVKT